MEEQIFTPMEVQLRGRLLAIEMPLRMLLHKRADANDLIDDLVIRLTKCKDLVKGGKPLSEYENRVFKAALAAANEMRPSTTQREFDDLQNVVVELHRKPIE